MKKIFTTGVFSNCLVLQRYLAFYRKPAKNVVSLDKKDLEGSKIHVTQFRLSFLENPYNNFLCTLIDRFEFLKFFGSNFELSSPFSRGDNC